MWILGETKDHEPPTIQQCEDFVKDKNVTFPVLRDYNFLQTYGAMEAVATALPHQYVIDGDTMELLQASGGLGVVNAESVINLLKAHK